MGGRGKGKDEVDENRILRTRKEESRNGKATRRDREDEGRGSGPRGKREEGKT